MALIGTTGSGKSTTADLLMGLLHPTAGQIMVDGKNIHDPHYPERLASWQLSIAHVPQNVFLIDGSISQNIAIGIPQGKIDHRRVRESAKFAHIASFVESSKFGYDMVVGERGIQLSGGQRQRIAIARAFYKQAHLIILDEATSALDSHTERAVMESIENLSHETTLVIIAHRLSTIRSCDTIIKLEAGRVVALGKPESILPNA